MTSGPPNRCAARSEAARLSSPVRAPHPGLALTGVRAIRSAATSTSVEMMRSAFREDEWMLYAHGAVMGFGGGVLHLLLFGAGGS